MFRKPSLLVLAALVGIVLAYQGWRRAPQPAAQPTLPPSAQPTAQPPSSPATTTPQALMVVTPVTLPRATRPRSAPLAPPAPTELPVLARLQQDGTDAVPPPGKPVRPKREDREGRADREAGKHYDQPDEAAEYYKRKRAPKGQGIPTERYAVARTQMQQMRTYSSRLDMFGAPGTGKTTPELLFGSGWTPLGPGNIGGRTRAILINPVNPNIVYAAGVAGGIWRSSDGGLNWIALADIMANLAVCTLALDPANPNVIYAGTGEGFGNGDAVRGAGIFKTTNGSITWDQLPTTNTPDFYYVNKVVISPTNNQRLYAATRTGVWRSLNGGATWTKTYDTSVNLGVLDVALRTDQATEVVFATTG